ncbi:DUF4244 domain-containing protein [Corynebacterium sp. MC-04]|uniref:DUF4244 domain-containing protein n=1 Tax=Corynebacterium parakroppenstedtii TaxID=2828363 RepID=A0ABS9HLJ4_9CORY|nr:MULTISPECIES: DUF4244 domain-containing protein [Corynebacterium]MDU3196815.1 DUF4244 domain-containing protein [Corynebacterium kroppenstedtii]MCF6770059.1 DUF4244 domain-containing protein [Corynebacterium parakroppenstedtii]MCF6772157.1 DUF4244 domain-containing protein [Corynebacterium parakroppenstedtii]MCF6774211.1 DUF4244 domain-containing protein [Corynebacterium parakroppenstedtii]MCF6779449.1 DUF4244 domain-containing protein [Corynebacterium parakroppenstedtii]
MTCAVPTHAVPTNPIAEQHTSTDTDAQLSSRSVDTSPADDISISDNKNTSEPSPMRWWDRARAALFNERGMATLEYALVCVAAAAFAGLLYVIVSGGEVENALKGIIEDALNSKKK